MGVQAGADGIIVSNHGGRQLDFAPAALDALPGIAAAVGKRVPVLMDGGVRRGTDIIKVGNQSSDVVCSSPWYQSHIAQTPMIPVGAVPLCQSDYEQTLHQCRCTSA